MRDLTEPELQSLRAGKCPFCQSQEFYEGPSGGMSLNWYCANESCGAGFNEMFHGLGPFRAGQLIQEPAGRTNVET